MPAQPPPIPIVESVSAIGRRYEAWLCDIWGVLHNGKAAVASAVAACQVFRGGGGIVVLVSNAPRPHTAVAAQLASAYGITAACYDAIVSSGDVARDLLAAHRPRTRVAHIGPARDVGIFEGLEIESVATDDADLILCSGLVDDTSETPESYRSLLERLARRRVPMLCANPDIKVERGAEIVWCAGALAALYRTLDGDVTYAGKPHAPIYETAFATVDRLAGHPVARERILAIGDGLDTDVRGAALAQIDALYVASAVHLAEPLTAAALERLLATQSGRPVAATAALA